MTTLLAPATDGYEDVAANGLMVFDKRLCGAILSIARSGSRCSVLMLAHTPDAVCRKTGQPQTLAAKAATEEAEKEASRTACQAQ